MGSDRKSKEKKSKKRNSYSSGSEDERKSKRHRTEEDGDRKSRKSDKKEKRTDKKFQKKSKDKHKSKHHRSDRHLQEVQVLSNDDYFSKNNEFATWLKEEKNVFFSDLSSESAHEHFSYFVKAWNDQKLETRYYEGISSGPRTSHNWKIRK
ncbi:style cell-cycle inhibitor 1 isoform X3 [Alnus glutinosa]|uniref:style cell-cycle inhibitor 1 isoform X3 n=1 Tax=Alnus glutinosa TaxID=3517 RepID=UPI002D768F2C|nr:style cell-cycle inhibitor 1 isoform X3 [Alnus glutinosa]